MKLHRFIINNDLNMGSLEIKDIEIINQIKNVLRLKNKDNFILCDGLGKEAFVEIEEINKNKILVKILEIKEKKDVDKKVSLYLSILKKENFELGVQKAIELGVSEIIPIITDRTIKNKLNYIRLEKIIKEASEQSGRTIIPKLLPILSFKEAIEDGLKNEEKIFYDLVNNKLDKINKESSSFSIFIGPEGGFTNEENKFAKEKNYKIISLSKFTLRAETATIVGVSKILN